MAKRVNSRKVVFPLLMLGLLAFLALLIGLISYFSTKEDENSYLIDETSFIYNVKEGDEFTVYTNIELPFWQYDSDNETYEINEVDRKTLHIKVMNSYGESIVITVSNAYNTLIYSVEIQQLSIPVESINLDLNRYEF